MAYTLCMANSSRECKSSSGTTVFVRTFQTYIPVVSLCDWSNNLKDMPYNRFSFVRYTIRHRMWANLENWKTASDSNQL